jgi:hypothetical protein
LLLACFVSAELSFVDTHLGSKLSLRQAKLCATLAVGKALRRTLFRSRVWRLALIRAGLLGTLTVIDDATVRAGWTDATGATLTKELPNERVAVLQIARSHAGGFRCHDLKRSYAI